MKKRFYSKTRKKHRVRKYLFLLLFVFGMYIAYQYLDQSPINIDQKEFVKILLSKDQEKSLAESVLSIIFPSNEEKVVALLENNYQNLIIEEQPKVVPIAAEVEQGEPCIYIYNSHQTEEYTPNTFVEYSVMPTVMMNDYILEEKFEEHNFATVVEERNIKEVLNQNGWNYAKSYQASRVFLEDVRTTYPSLKYFIDVHRDSLGKDRTTVTIGDKNYASILFLIGLENPNYQQNLEFTEKINQKINEKYPNLSKGIYKKEGPGVNGVYNQDFSPFTILVEMGGPENTIDEVLNTSLAFADCFLEVINEYELH